VTRRLGRAPLLAVAMFSMVWGIWMGLLRIGWVLPLPRPDQLILHGPLMIGGFIGTLIGLERAVGIATPWAYAAPLLTASGAVLLIFGRAPSVAALLTTLGSVVVLLVFAVVMSREASLFALTMALGAVAWLAGNAQWLAGMGIYRVVSCWMAFLVLTIAGERLELNRLRRPSLMVRAAFVVTIVVTCTGVAIGSRWPDGGMRATGAGFVMLSIWLASCDVARRTVRQPGVTRFISVCLLSGYAWLGAGGSVALATGAATPGPTYDAILHAVFLGFVVSMIFGHALIVFPAILGRPMPFRSAFYVHLALLHASVIVRLIGDLAEDLGRWRPWGGALNAVAIGVFAVNSAVAISNRPHTRVQT
jgi:hypothetical protein